MPRVVRYRAWCLTSEAFSHLSTDSNDAKAFVYVAAVEVHRLEHRPFSLISKIAENF